MALREGAWRRSAEVDFRPTYESVVNDPVAARLAAEVCDELVGSGNVRRRLPAGTGSEDFSYMLNEVPGCYRALRQRGHSSGS